MKDHHIENLVEKYIKNRHVVAVGTSKFAESFLTKLALKCENDGIVVKFVPTSAKLAAIASSLKIPMVSLNDREVDVAIEFANAVDDDYNFIKYDTTSLIRDKMIAQSAANLIVITEEKNCMSRLRGTVPFEISSFAPKRTVAQLCNFGRASLRLEKGQPAKTELNHYLADVELAEYHTLQDLELKAKEIPGVLESGLFIGYADTLISYNRKITVKSRLRQYSEVYTR